LHSTYYNSDSDSSNMANSDAEYRRELEAELERLTKELTNVRVQKSKQRQRIEQLQVEQNQLKNQLEDSSNSNDKELRTGLAQQLNTLSQVVKQKKVEHSKVKQEWERSQEEYHQLKRTVGLLQGAPVNDLFDDAHFGSKDDDSLEDDLNNIPPAASTQSKDFLQSMWGSMKSNPNTSQGNSFRAAFAEGLADEASASQASNFFSANFDHASGFQTSFSKEFETMPEAGNGGGARDAFLFHEDEEAEAEAALENEDYDGNDDGGTVITEHTKDSLQVYRKNKDESRRPPREGGEGRGGGLGTFFEKEKKKTSSTSYTTKIKDPNGDNNRGAME
jgi:major membrane immunogen (membrane-anchored lipoprotein)